MAVMIKNLGSSQGFSRMQGQVSFIELTTYDTGCQDTRFVLLFPGKYAGILRIFGIICILLIAACN